jgi:hypothetical protein
VKRAGGIVSLALVNAVDKVTTAVDKVAAGTDRSAAAAAIPVLEQAIEAEIAKQVGLYNYGRLADFDNVARDLRDEAQGLKRLPLFHSKKYAAGIAKLTEMYARLDHYREIVLS